MRTWFAAGLVAGAMMLAGAPAVAQDGDFDAQVRSYLDAGMAPHASRGYRRDNTNQDVIAPLTLNSGGQVAILNLRRGQNYRVYGACDNDCSDLDLEIYDSEGAFVERDVALDDVPFVQIAPTESGRYVARFWVAACAAEPCYSGIRVVVGGTPEQRAAEASGGGDFASGVASLLDQAGTGFAGEGFAPIPNIAPPAIEGLMLSGEGQRGTYALRAGQAYRFAAACDSDCTDIDIEVQDSAGQTVASNLGVDNPTSVDFTPSRNGDYVVRAWLAVCSAEPCFAGQRGYVRGR